jgi:hypothetical protein
MRGSQLLVAALVGPTAAMYVPGAIQSSSTIGPRAGVIVTTTSAPSTTDSKIRPIPVTV